MQWAEASLGSICDDGQGLIKTGPFGSQLHQSDYCVDGTPVVMPKDIVGGRLVDVSIARVSQEHIDRLAHHKLKAGDIVYGRRGDIGRCALIRERESGWLCGTGCLRVSLGEGDVLPQYLFYYLNDPSVVAWISNQAVGATMPNLNTGILRSIPVRYPPKGIQNRIVSILSAYDDLIENNTRRIEILEEMARRLYEEWFVQFRFPGHEGVEFKESELGPIPEGWDLTTVAETFEILGGGTPSKSEPAYWEDGHINWYSPTDLTRSGTSFMDESSAKITDIGLSRSSAKMFPPYSVMLTSRATIGVVAINTTPATTNQGFITCIPNKRFPLYLLFHWVKNNVDRFIGLGTGATFKEITKGVFKGIELVVPPVVLVDDFQRKVTPLMDMILRLLRKNRNLRTQRDLLLPKLISGEIDVSDIPMPT